MSGRWTTGVALVGCALAGVGARAAEGSSQTPVTPPVAGQDAASGVPAAEAADGAHDVPGPFDGSLGAGLAEVRRLTEAGEVDAALALSERLLAPDPAARLRAWLERQSGGLSERALGWFDRSLAGPLRALGLDPGTSAERAEVHYARGVALRTAARASEAREAYGLVRGLGGAARPDAVYELGHVALVAGEGWRAEIPELAPPGSQPPSARSPGAQPPGAAPPGVHPPGGGPPGAPAPDEPDPLQEARRAYQSALEAFVERLRLDWRDADTRANVELVRRRLRELDELEQQRKEDQQQQQDQQQQDQGQKDQKDPKQQDQEQKDPQEQDPDQKDPEQKDPQQQDPQEAEPEQPEEQPEPEAGEEPEEQPGPEEQPEPTPEPEEGQLTKEQLQRLQQLLEQNRKLGEEIEKAFRQRSRGRTARDW